MWIILGSIMSSKKDGHQPQGRLDHPKETYIYIKYRVRGRNLTWARRGTKNLMLDTRYVHLRPPRRCAQSTLVATGDFKNVQNNLSSAFVTSSSFYLLDITSICLQKVQMKCRYSGQNRHYRCHHPACVSRAIFFRFIPNADKAGEAATLL